MATARERLIEDLLESIDIRREVADEHLNARIALQIKALRQKRGWTQSELGTLSDLGQTQVSDFENVNHSAWTMLTLKRLATAFDLPLLVSFGSWSEMVKDSSRLSRSRLERPTFEEDPVFSAAREANAITNERLVELFQAAKDDFASTDAEEAIPSVLADALADTRGPERPEHAAEGAAMPPQALAA